VAAQAAAKAAGAQLAYLKGRMADPCAGLGKSRTLVVNINGGDSN
jgi:hypothetical protein